MIPPNPQISIFPPPPQDEISFQKSHIYRELFGPQATFSSRSGNMGASEILLYSHPSKLPKILYINWTEQLALTFLMELPLIFKLLTRTSITTLWLAHFWINRSLKYLQSRNVKIIYHVHDLHSNWLEPKSIAAKVDHIFKREVLKKSDAWIVHEASALKEVTCQQVQKPSLIKVCPLGDYSLFHGAPVDKSEARRRLKLTKENLVFFCFGFFQKRRDPTQLIEAFLSVKQPHWRLIVAGSGSNSIVSKLSSYSDIEYYSEFVSDETLRDLFCSCDWSIMNGEQHLTSAAARTSISYGKPVITEAFGSQIDMLKGCFIPIIKQTRDDYSKAFLQAASTSSRDYAAITSAAIKNHKERTWQRFHNNRNSMISTIYSGTESCSA